MAGTFNPGEDQALPGLYMRFVNAANAQIRGGARGVVAIPITLRDRTITTTLDKTVYEIDTISQAATLFGAAFIKPIQRILGRGANKVIVYTLPTYDAETAAADYIELRETLDAYTFNAFVFPDEVEVSELDLTFAWVKQNYEDGRPFYWVLGGSAADDQVPATANTRSIKYADKSVINLGTGTIEAGSVVSSAVFAADVAGIVTGIALNKGITFMQITGVDDVSIRLTKSQRTAALAAGTLIFINDGTKVKIQQGLCTSKDKIRKISAEFAIFTDVTREGEDNYIGKKDNTPDGQIGLITAIKAYLERLAAENVLFGGNDIQVALSATQPSTGDRVYIDIRVKEVDSMEYIYVTVYKD